MRNVLRWALGAWIFAAGPVLGQAPPPPVFPAPAPLPGELQVPVDVNGNPVVVGLPAPAPAAPDPTRFWVRAEFLSWWVKDAPRPVALITSGDPNSNPDGDMHHSNTHYNNFSGMRLSIGGWIDTPNNLGFEANYFFLGRRTNTSYAASDNNGFPMLAFPFTSTDPAAPGSFIMPISSPGQFAGNVYATSSLELWGTEFNGVLCLLRTPTVELTMLGGFRYVDLQESLHINSVSSDITTNPNTVTFLSDNFNTRNQFYGGQLGGRFSWLGERWAIDLTGKLALGSTHQVVDIQGSSTQFGPGGPNGTFPGGFFVQPSNMGRVSANQFTVLPSLELKLHYALTPRWRVFLGYDFLYWSQVVRPGSQIDRNINLTQSVIFGNGALNGPATPTPLFNRTDFWTQGISFGFEFRF